MPNRASPLSVHIRELIAARGPITLADYMQLALQHPEHGYYRHGDPLGHAGDFITAPEISQMFGEMIGLWCADVWRLLGEPAAFALVELGPGRGTLMQDALRAAGKIAGFQKGLTLYLLESSVTLRAMQEEKLAAHKPKFIADIGELPPLPALIIANEFFDALPIRQFEKTFQGWCENLVTAVADGFAFTQAPLDAARLMLIPEALREAVPGTVHEVSPAALSAMRALARHVAQYGGVALAIDYGYAEETGRATLQAIAQHEMVNPLTRPGEVDLTAHVDFAALRHAAGLQGVRAFGPLGQGEFLQTLGIDLRAAQLKRTAAPEQAKDIDSALQRLCDPSQMGVLFKALAIAGSVLTELPGF